MTQNKNVTLTFSASTDHWSLIDKATEITGQAITTFMLDAVLEKSRTITKAARATYQEAIVPDRVSFVLNETSFIKFVGEITTPIKHNPGLAQLKSVVPVWNTDRTIK